LPTWQKDHHHREPGTSATPELDDLRAAHRLIWTGEVEAVDETAAIEKTAEKLKVPTTKLIAARRRWSCPAQEAQAAQLAVQP